MGELADKVEANVPARRALRRLDQRKVDRLKEPGRYADAAGLYLQISEQGVASWVFRYERNGRKERTMGLGPRYDVSLEATREEARLQRELLRQGIDPIDARATQRAEAKEAAASEVTFADTSAGRIRAMESKWKNAKHRQQWENTLATYTEPLLGKMVVRSINAPRRTAERSVLLRRVNWRC